MQHRKRFAFLLVPCLLLAVALVCFPATGCKKGDSGGGGGDDKGKGKGNQPAAALTIGYSDWPGWLVWEIANQKNFFKDAGVDVKMEWFTEYVKSIDAFTAKKLDGLLVVCGDALPAGIDVPSTAIVLTDYSNGNDMIIGQKGIKSVKDLKGKKVGLDLNLVEHILLAEAVKKHGLKEEDVGVVQITTDDTPAALKTGKVDAIGAWYPISWRALKEVPDANVLFTSEKAPGLIYDALHVNRESLVLRRDDWKKVVGVWFRCLKFLNDPKTRDEALKIMAGRINAKAEDLEKNLKGTRLLDREENLKAMNRKLDRLEGDVYSVYGSLKNANEFYLRRKLPKYESQDIYKYVDSSLVREIEAK
jgi:NitT/TauT family transport system substrate-binding protein